MGKSLLHSLWSVLSVRSVQRVKPIAEGKKKTLTSLNRYQEFTGLQTGKQKTITDEKGQTMGNFSNKDTDEQNQISTQWEGI